MRSARLFAFLIALVSLFVLVGCGGGGDSTGNFRSLVITPTSPNLKPGETTAFTAVLDGNPVPITWTVLDAGGGEVNATGQYTAPLRSGTYRVRVALASDPSKFSVATVTVESGFVVSIETGGRTRLGFGDVINLSAAVSGTANQGFRWSTTAGFISQEGEFTAPDRIGGVTVRATSIQDPAKFKEVTFQVSEPIRIVTPRPTPLMLVRSKLTFAAFVLGAPSTAVTWSTSAGTISTTGELTAPDASGTVTVTATSVANPTKSATLDVVVANNVNVRLKIEGKDDILVALRPDKAPNHCANLVTLVNQSFYNGIIFHRYEAGFVIQGGDPLTKTLPLTDPQIGTGGPGYTIPFEANDLLHTQYALAMARSTGLDTAGSQFYFALTPQPGLDGSYVVFGSVLSGTSVVDALRRGDKILTATTEAVASGS